MDTYWVIVRTGPAAQFRATVKAPNPWIAYEMFKGMYGNQLLSEAASLLVEPRSLYEG